MLLLSRSWSWTPVYTDREAYRPVPNSSMVALSSILQGASAVKTCGTCNTQQYFSSGSSMAQCKCTTRLQPTMKGTDGFWKAENVTKISMGDIIYSQSAPIHPICRPENFSGVDYDTLKPVLRLASAMLLSEHSLRFLHTVMCGEYTSPTGDQKEGTLHPSDLTLTADQKRAALRKLRMLTWIVNFLPTDTAHDTEHGCSAVTRPNYGKSHPVLPNGRGSIIQFSQGFVDAIVADSAAAALGAPDNAARVWNIFAFAKTLAHEIAHAANVAVRNRIAPREPFYGSYHSCSELGFHWENCVFGGLYTAFDLRVKNYFSMRKTLNGDRPKTLDCPRTILFTAYPQNANLREYLLRNNNYAVRGTLGLFDIFTRVPVKTVATFLTSAYWTAEAQAGGCPIDSHLLAMFAGDEVQAGPARTRLAPVRTPRGAKLLWFHSAAMNQKDYDTMLSLIAGNGKGVVMKGQYSMHEAETQLTGLAMVRQEISLNEVAELLKLTRLYSMGFSATEMLERINSVAGPSAGAKPRPFSMPMAVAAAVAMSGASTPVATRALVSGTATQKASAVSKIVGQASWTDSMPIVRPIVDENAKRKTAKAVANQAGCNEVPSPRGAGRPDGRCIYSRSHADMPNHASSVGQVRDDHDELDSPDTCSAIVVECDFREVWISLRRVLRGWLRQMNLV